MGERNRRACKEGLERACCRCRASWRPPRPGRRRPRIRRSSQVGGHAHRRRHRVRAARRTGGACRDRRRRGAATHAGDAERRRRGAQRRRAAPLRRLFHRARRARRNGRRGARALRAPRRALRTTAQDAGRGLRSGLLRPQQHRLRGRPWQLPHARCLRHRRPAAKRRRLDRTAAARALRALPRLPAGLPDRRHPRRPLSARDRPLSDVRQRGPRPVPRVGGSGLAHLRRGVSALPAGVPGERGGRPARRAAGGVRRAGIRGDPRRCRALRACSGDARQARRAAASTTLRASSPGTCCALLAG